MLFIFPSSWVTEPFNAEGLTADRSLNEASMLSWTLQDKNRAARCARGLHRHAGDRETESLMSV